VTHPVDGNGLAGGNHRLTISDLPPPGPSPRTGRNLVIS
jgi:hypothetical protein